MRELHPTPEIPGVCSRTINLKMGPHIWLELGPRSTPCWENRHTPPVHAFILDQACGPTNTFSSLHPVRAAPPRRKMVCDAVMPYPYHRVAGLAPRKRVCGAETCAPPYLCRPGARPKKTIDWQLGGNPRPLRTFWGTVRAASLLRE